MTTQATTPAPEPDGQSSRRLTRSSSDRVIAGVAGGIGRYFNFDPVVIRIAFVVLLFFGGAGVIAYGAAWLLVPRDDGTQVRFGGRDILRRGVVGLAILIGTLVVGLGGAWAVAVGGGTATAIVIIGAGLALIAGAVTGGMRWLILPALVLALSAGAVSAADIDARGGVGERTYAPISSAGLRSEYKLGVGKLRLDLRHTDFTPGDHQVHIKLGVGDAEVWVPESVCVSSTAHISAGATGVFSHDYVGGLDHDWEDINTPAPGSPGLTIDADIGVGGLTIMHGPIDFSAGNTACERG